MLKVYEELKFDNPDGGAWKQGWRVTYPEGKWNSDNMLYVFVLPHSHTDPGWVKKFTDYYTQQTKPILDNVLNVLSADSRRRFIYAELSFFSLWWESLNAARKETVKRLMKNGQLEVATGGWVMNDEANAHYAAMVDQLIEGNQYLHGTTGFTPRSGWAIDPFGHSPTMAYLLKRSGVTGMLIQRVHYTIKKHFARNKNLEFMWRQLWDKDGTTDILCHTMPFYSYDVPHTCGPDPKICCQFDFARMSPSPYSCPWRVPPQAITDSNVADRAAMLIDQYKKKASLYRSNALFIPLGDDFRYDKADECDKQFNNYQKIFDYLDKNPQLGVKAQFGTLSEYFNKLHELTGSTPDSKPEDYPVLTGDFFTYADKDDHFWSGYYTTRPFQKQMDRHIETSLRSAEIALTLAAVYQKKHRLTGFPEDQMMQLLVEARRNLGLFQHHDGITGTAKDFVVVDYGERLLKAENNCRTVTAEAVSFISMATKSDYKQNRFFDIDETRPTHVSLIKRNVLQVSSEPSAVLLYNSLTHPRQQVVNLHVSDPNVEVTDAHGKVVTSQTDPYWTEPSIMSQERFKLSFVAEVSALGIARYQITKKRKNVHHSLGKVTYYNSEGPSEKSAFTVERKNSMEFTLASSHLEASFSGSTGLLKTVKMKSSGQVHKSEVSFQTYGARSGKERSGAYLFLPDGPAKSLRVSHPVIRVVSGPVVSEVSVFINHVQHVVRLQNSPGTDGRTVDMYNLVDVRKETNYELAVKISTDIHNIDKEFFTDLNGFQMIKHKTFDKLPTQANVYPMPAMAFIEDDKTRFSVLTAQSLGVASLQTGEIQVMLDRTLNQDDMRGLGQGVRDNTLTPNRFKLMFESRSAPPIKDRTSGFPSLQAHMTYLHLVHNIQILPQKSSVSVPPLISQHSFLSGSLPCDVHLLNLRSLQQSYDGPITRSDDSALLLHRLGLDCGISSHGLPCTDTQGKVRLRDLFSDTLGVKEMRRTSLTLLHDKGPTSLDSDLTLNPMEIYSFKVKW
ncbi:alpha-mannosidase 2x-like isoform X3 [Ostrea edulis]|nr:alpha-mannosidase 2x-like isoform X3 [Ostrea edulis]